MTPNTATSAQPSPDAAHERRQAIAGHFAAVLRGQPNPPPLPEDFDKQVNRVGMRALDQAGKRAHRRQRGQRSASAYRLAKDGEL